MISVKYREEGSEDYKLFVAARLTYVACQGEFTLYDTDDNIVRFVTPAHLEATATINAPNEGKED